jgi:hypothetical protein
MMTIKYGLQFFFELTDNDGQNFLAGIVQLTKKFKLKKGHMATFSFRKLVDHIIVVYYCDSVSKFSNNVIEQH